MDDKSCDIIVAGAGVAGVLSCAKLAILNPQLNILLLDKDPGPGGRLRTTGAIEDHWSSGLNGVSDSLYEQINQALKENPESDDLSAVVTEKRNTVGILAGGKVSQISTKDIFGPLGAKAIGGRTAQKDWEKVEDILQTEDDTQRQGAFSKSWKLPKKNAATIVAEHFAPMFGVTNIWTSSNQSLKDRSNYIQEGLYVGPWESVLENLIKQSEGSIDVKYNCRIVEAKREGNLWTLETEQGEFSAKELVIAQDPWNTLHWLSKEYWPAHILEVALKSKPVSVVALSATIEKYDEIPDILMIPSEKAQVYTYGKKEICFQAVIDFELSLDAPEVVKAIKRLKRARKKLLKKYENLEIKGEHLVLKPVAWSQSTHTTDRRLLNNIRKKGTSGDHIYYCGDSYGDSYVGDKNIVSSITHMCETISNQT